ncbi:MFS transporter [Mucilaginibacter sp. SG564]|uniref:MFS transporter n=1 Tax=Mucilaginibacter sp. SG564 TaxID=2587022 RepID=UPI00155786DD|nr:MFS transporter [Mucilaginibacter sp. SG564]NOW95941.1 DHA2 family multidrug resistance protein [Mucilaginibacter sp. SG564]
MRNPVYFKDWIANWGLGIRILLFLILLSAIMQFGSFTLSQNYIMAYLGAQPEDISFAIQITYVGILINVPLAFRFLRYFEMRNYLLTNMILGIILNVCCLHTSDIYIFFILRFFQGICINAVCIGALIMITGVLNPAIRQVLGPSVFFGTVFSSTVFIGIIAANATVNSQIINIYIYTIIFQGVVLALILCSLRAKTRFRKYPPFRIDWPGLLFYAVGGICLAYTLLYGTKYYWFSDPRIVISSALVILSSLMFFGRQLLATRPLIDVTVFKYKNFIAGLLVLGLYYGMKESINILYGYTAFVLKWSPTQTINLGLCNILSLIFFMIITARLLINHKKGIIPFLLVGFSMLLAYHFWVYYNLTPDLSFSDLVVPVIFQGAASGILFVPITVFVITSVPKSTGVAPLFLAANTRFISLLNANAGFYNLQIYFNQIYRESLINHLSPEDLNAMDFLSRLTKSFLTNGLPEVSAQQAANSSLQSVLETQSQLLADRAIFSVISLAIIGILLTILMFKVLSGIVTALRKNQT